MTSKTEVIQKAKWVLTHDDGKCSDGKRNTVLIDGFCPVCRFVPDMQSTCFVFHCPFDDVRLDKDGKCPTCKKSFDRSR